MLTVRSCLNFFSSKKNLTYPKQWSAEYERGAARRILKQWILTSEYIPDVQSDPLRNQSQASQYKPMRIQGPKEGWQQWLWNLYRLKWVTRTPKLKDDEYPATSRTKNWYVSSQGNVKRLLTDLIDDSRSEKWKSGKTTTTTRARMRYAFVNAQTHLRPHKHNHCSIVRNDESEKIWHKWPTDNPSLHIL